MGLLVYTGKSKEALGAQLFHDQVKRLLDKGVDKFLKGYEAYVGSNNSTVSSVAWNITLRCSRPLAVANAALITVKHIDFKKEPAKETAK